MNEKEEARVLAEEVMGWHLEFLIGIDPEPHGWWFVDKDEEPQMYCWDWQPETNLTQAMMVMNKHKEEEAKP